MGLPIVALYGGMCAVLNVLLGMNVSRNRGKDNVLLGHGDVGSDLHKANRAHANNSEYVPMALIMLLVAEAGGAHSVSMHSLGGILFVARLAHAHGILADARATRIAGILFTWLVILGAAAYALLLHFRPVSG